MHIVWCAVYSSAGSCFQCLRCYRKIVMLFHARIIIFSIISMQYTVALYSVVDTVVLLILQCSIVDTVVLLIL